MGNEFPAGAKDRNGKYIVPGGQGYDSSHVQSPLHEVAKKAGYEYSHSTPIGGKMHHTYARGEHKVGVTENKWESQTSSASGRSISGNGSSSLEKHLTNKVKRYGKEYGKED